MNDKKHHILLVEDEEHLQEALKLNLELENYEVSCSSDGADALKVVHQEHFDLIILDVMLPEVDGMAVCESMRLQHINVPILMLSAKNTSADRVAGLKKGADDYLTKPFNLEELLIRVENLIRKNEMISDRGQTLDVYQFGKNKIDFNGLVAYNKKGKQFKLTKTESMLLKLLIDNKNEVVTRERMLQSVWGYQVYPNTRSIDNVILAFRKYFEEDSRNPVYFHSVRGLGYKFTED
jgi:two-component system alkaline phosphatase synthesis response regulator PhoP